MHIKNDVKEQKTLSIVMILYISVVILQNSKEISEKNIELTYCLEISVLCIYSKELKSKCGRNVCITIYIATLFIVTIL